MKIFKIFIFCVLTIVVVSCGEGPVEPVIIQYGLTIRITNTITGLRVAGVVVEPSINTTYADFENLSSKVTNRDGDAIWGWEVGTTETFVVQSVTVRNNADQLLTEYNIPRELSSGWNGILIQVEILE